MFYLMCRSLDERTELIKHLKSKDILAVFHYLSLHGSEYYKDKHDGRALPNCDRFADCLLRLPMFYELDNNMQQHIISAIKEYFQGTKNRWYYILHKYNHTREASVFLPKKDKLYS